MKKSYKNMIILSAAATLFAFAGSAQAAVSGQCSNCHTMHDSQGGVEWSADNAGDEGPYSALLINDCLGCHTSSAGDPLSADGYPYVANGNAFSDDNCLAGGFLSTGGENNDDNSHTMGTNFLPAGYDSAGELGDWYTGDTEASGFSCAGTNGCHGNHTDLNDMDAIAGGHHNTDNAYRILYVDLAGDKPVAGEPTLDYEENLIATTGLTSTGPSMLAHNVYSAGPNDNTISELCGICHGNFHGAGTTDSATWLRHPTDVVIPSDWIIGNEIAYPLTDADHKHNPVGWDGAEEGTGERKATCLSCHRAHGTANADLLRWAYSTQDAGSQTTYGCLGCHDKQR